MSFASWPRGPRCAGTLAGALIVALAASVLPAGADTVSVHVDQSRIIKLPDRVATIVIGNPLIADASLQNGGIMVLTGKGYGSTNLMALDRAGRVLMQNEIQVIGPGTDDIVVVYRGVDRETYSCAPFCERRITLGDTPAYFTATIAQTAARNGAQPAAK